MENGLKIIHKTDRACRALFIPEEVLGCWLRSIRRADREREWHLALDRSLILGAVGTMAWAAAALELMAPGLAAAISLVCLWGLGRNAEKMNGEGL